MYNIDNPLIQPTLCKLYIILLHQEVDKNWTVTEMTNTVAMNLYWTKPETIFYLTFLLLTKLFFKPQLNNLGNMVYNSLALPSLRTTFISYRGSGTSSID